MKNVVVFFGGVSQERDVSIITGVLTLNSLDVSLFRPVPVYVDKDGLWYTGAELNKVGFFKNLDKRRLDRVTVLMGENQLYRLKNGRLKEKTRIDCAINCLHGRNGEDGSLSGVLRLCGIPSASPDIFSSAASLDKIKTKLMLKGLNVDTARYSFISREDYFKDKFGALKKAIGRIGYPVIIKPASSGSSIGITVANDDETALTGVENAFSYDNFVLAESYICGAEDVNCAAMRINGEIVVSECERPSKNGDILSFADKYTSKTAGAAKEFPAKIGKRLTEKIKRITKRVYLGFGFSGVVRVDFLISGGKVLLNEINGVPGSMAYYLFGEKLSDFTLNLTALIVQGIKDQLHYEGCRTDYKSDVLSFKGVSLKK